MSDDDGVIHAIGGQLEDLICVGDHAAMCTLLDASPQYPARGHTNQYGTFTPLPCAALKGRVECVRALLERGAFLQGGVDAYGNSLSVAVLYACSKWNYERQLEEENALHIIKALMDAGDSLQTSPTQLTDKPGNLLHFVAELGLEMIGRFLLDMGIFDPHEENPTHETPFQVAERAGHGARMQFLET